MIQPTAPSSLSLASLLPSAPAPTGGAADFALSLATLVEGIAAPGQPIAVPGNPLPPASDALPMRVDPPVIQALAPVSAAVIGDPSSATLTEIIAATPLEDTPTANAPPVPVPPSLVTRAPVAPRPVVSRRAPDAAEVVISKDHDGETKPDEIAQAEAEPVSAAIADVPALPVTAAASLNALAIALSAPASSPTPVPAPETPKLTTATLAAAQPDMAPPTRTIPDMSAEAPSGSSGSASPPVSTEADAPAPASTSALKTDITDVPQQTDLPRTAAAGTKDVSVQPARSPRLAPASSARPSRRTPESMPVEPGKAVDRAKAAPTPLASTIMQIVDAPSPAPAPTAPDIARPRHDAAPPSTAANGVEPIPVATPAQPIAEPNGTQAVPPIDRQPVGSAQWSDDVPPIAAKSGSPLPEQVPADEARPMVSPLPAPAMPVAAMPDRPSAIVAPGTSAQPQSASPHITPPPAAAVDVPTAPARPAVTPPAIATGEVARTAAPLERPAPAPAPAPTQPTRFDTPAPPPIQPATIASAAPTSTPSSEVVVPSVMTATVDVRQPAARPTVPPPPNQVALPASEAPALVAGTTAPAFRLFAAALHAARTDESEQATLSAPVAVATVDQVRAPAAVSGAQDAPLDMTSHRWPEAMVERIERLQETASAARDAASTSIRLAPDALGTIDVSVRTEGDRVHVHFTAEQAATRTLLADAQPRLADLAEAKGLRLTQGSIGGGTDGGGQRQPTPQAAPARPVAAAPARAVRDDEPDTLTTRIA